MGAQGTKALFGQWLQSKKGLTYTKYAKLPADQKAKIQKEYGERKVASPLPIVTA